MIINIIALFLLGLICGSFINSLIYRLFYNISLWKRSICPICKVKLKAKDLIPLLSYLILQAKCRYCQKKISIYYFLVELTTGTLFVLAYLHYQAITLFLVRDLFFILVLIFIMFFDLKYYLVLDKIIWGSLAIAFVVNILLGVVWWNLLIGLLIGGMFFLLQYLLTNGKAVGFGDVNLGMLIGVMLGWQLTILTLFIAYIIGGIIAIIFVLSKKKKMKDILPMGTFLAIGAIIALLIGENILRLIF